MNRDLLIRTLKRERAAWESLLGKVGASRMVQPTLDAGWSVKDMIGHVTWYEREIVELLESRALASSDLWELPADERNARIHEAGQDLPLPVVLRESEQVFERLVRAVASLSDEDLVDASHFRDMPESWIPWEVVADNTYEHYRQHTPALRAWLEGVREPE